MNKIKNFIKSKKGSFAIVGVMVIPLVVFIVFYIIFTQMNENMSYKRVQTAVDNALYYAANEYGDIKSDKYGNSFCDFDSSVLNGNDDEEVSNLTTINTSAKDKFLWNFDTYIKQCDGYNDLWSYTLKIDDNTELNYDSNKNENNEYIAATIIVVLPDESNEKSVWGTAINDGTWTGWYASNKAHWESCVERYNEWYSENYVDWLKGEASAPTGLIVMKVEVSASCY